MAYFVWTDMWGNIFNAYHIFIAPKLLIVTLFWDVRGSKQYMMYIISILHIRVPLLCTCINVHVFLVRKLVKGRLKWKRNTTFKLLLSSSSSFVPPSLTISGVSKCNTGLSWQWPAAHLIDFVTTFKMWFSHGLKNVFQIHQLGTLYAGSWNSDCGLYLLFFLFYFL